ncbi:hypothetical protein Taro_033282 [Colocasia esculenta]|uniref:Uncharacterized protein n=1 Tax=Colocasia esculenta TaxID=4460 RepID=A0A843VZR1_COLES|nr:hypothetical protein [Colocasia esculenta]
MRPLSFLSERLCRVPGETSQQRQGGGDGAIVMVPVASSGSPSELYVTLGPFWVSGSVGGDRKNRVLGVGRGSSSPGRYSIDL